MTQPLFRRALALAATLVIPALFAPASAQAQSFEDWMHADIADAWQQGYTGQGVAVTVVDDFNSRSRFTGNLGTGRKYQTHGHWTYDEVALVAPGATLYQDDFNTVGRVRLQRGSLNVINLSYGIYYNQTTAWQNIRWGSQEQSLITYAQNGQAVVVKAAGNDSVAVGDVLSNGTYDAFNMALVGGQSTIFVGALDTNGSVANPASMASYSNYAGNDATVQSQFLVVGVEGDKTGLYGTSFAAPIVSGYAAILGSKFTTASATQITDRLLSTARTDTLVNYDPAIYGQGEASLSRALAPNSIN